MYVRPHLYAHERRIGTFPFNLPGIHHSLLAAILEYEHGIEVRSGTICNHRLVRRWFDISADDQATIEGKIRAGDRLASYGIVRVSLGIHNTKEDIDCLVEALSRIAVEGYRLRYRPLPSQETYEPILG
jgi:selenocysteine lyase/cysteine desulfurase